MKKAILRNIAIVSAIFIVVMSIMLVTNYFQVRGATPLQTTVMETLKQLNETNSNNPQLQEEIRQLDLMSRKAYFVQHDHLMVGIYILFGMLAVFVVCTHFYFADRKNIPDICADGKLRMQAFRRHPRIDVNMDDFCRRAEPAGIANRPVVKADSQRYNQIGLGRCMVRGKRSVHAGHADKKRIVAVHASQSHQSRYYRY